MSHTGVPARHGTQHRLAGKRALVDRLFFLPSGEGSSPLMEKYICALLVLVSFLVALLIPPSQAAILEIPNHNAVVSGIGVISGWKCDIEGELTVSFNDDDPMPLLHGSERTDTVSVCGDVRNGFVAIMNWGNLSEGTHTVVVYDNGLEFDRATFDVVKYGTGFLRGAHGQCDVQDFPVRGEVATLVWNQSTQHFELDEIWTEMEEPEEESEEDQHERIEALHQEIQNDNVSAARALLRAGADPNVINTEKGMHYTALHRAVAHEEGSLAMIELLLQHGADPNAHSSEFTGQYTALHSVFDYWLRHWQEDVLLVLDLLLDAGADVQAFTKDGSTPLHRAVSLTAYGLKRGSDWQLAPDVWNHVRTVFQTLIDAGADINAQGPIPQEPSPDFFGPYGRTILHTAIDGQVIYFGGTEIVEFLLDNGADPNLSFHSLRHIEEEGGLTPTYREVLVPDKTAFLYAMSGSTATNNRISLRLVHLFLDAGADPNIPDADGLTALFYVHVRGVKEEREDIERALISTGADPTHTFTRHDGEVVGYTCLTDECLAVQDGE